MADCSGRTCGRQSCFYCRTPPFVFSETAFPAGETLGGWELVQIFSHRRQQAQYSVVADPGDSKKVGFEVLVGYPRDIEP